MTDAKRNELAAILGSAAVTEERRQAARSRGDNLAEHALEEDLRALWRRQAELEREAAA
jgi:hypothetical protein